MKEKAGVTSKEIVEVLQSDIIFGQLQPMQHLIEDDLMARFAASRYVVRQALSDMLRTGLIVREEHRGCHVRGYSREEIVDLYEIRELLELRAVKRMALPVNDQFIKDIKAIQFQHEQASREGNLVRLFDMNNQFHETLYEACGSTVLFDAIKNFTVQTQPLRMRFFPDAGKRNTAVKDHWAIISALERGDRADLSDAVKRHIRRMSDALAKSPAHGLVTQGR